MVLTSLQNPRVKHLLALRERRQRKRDGLMLVDGQDEIRLALDCGSRPASIFYCPAFFPRQGDDGLLDRLRALGADLQEVDARVFEKLAYRENPDGWLASMPAPIMTLDELPLGPAPLLMVVEAVEKPGNLGAILRSADAAGVDGVVLCDPTVDLGNPNVIRSSRGTIFSVKVAEADGPAALAWLKARHIQIVAATPEAARRYTQVDLRGPVAIVVGAEGPGLSPLWRQSDIMTASVPMHGKINSLNVAQAASLFLFEAVRQRGGG
jgi:TrmH family RNA methyltransferase